MEEERRDMKAHKAYCDMLDFVANAQQRIPKLCPCGSITKEFIDEEDTYDYLPGKIYFICKDYQNDELHFRQPWVMGVQQEVERLKERVHEHENLLRECQALKGFPSNFHKGNVGIFLIDGSEMEEERQDMKAHKAYCDMLDFVANAQQKIPKRCPCGSITKEFVDEEDTYDYLPGKIYFICKDYQNDGLHFRQPWVMGVQQEVERLKERVHEHENLLRECQALKPRLGCCLCVCLNLRESSEVTYKTMCLMKTKVVVSSLFSHRLGYELFPLLFFYSKHGSARARRGVKAASKRKKTGKEEELAKLEGMLEIKKQISKQSEVQDHVPNEDKSCCLFFVQSQTRL
ncbi:hypothetical protein F2Q69_00051414 [Brassica cretica]|uniref:Uncharacterized protein n=1 Tax=Brassica cretica TaxID=69181 RepID=A0A8S9PQ41_BRACR|nr:hypothetical protein F2Q69_00051414 [Brassica cretica]